jgi:ParB-like chromosome segregation protein Spo0J
MDPVDLYRCGGQYYVLDGHHRIAVARALGERWVSANITDVRLNRLGARSQAGISARFQTSRIKTRTVRGPSS